MYPTSTSPVSNIHHRGHEINIPVGPEGEPMEFTGRIKGWLHDIMYGRVKHEWVDVVYEAGDWNDTFL